MTNIEYENCVRAAHLERSAALGAFIASIVLALWRSVRVNARLRPAPV